MIPVNMNCKYILLNRFVQAGARGAACFRIQKAVPQLRFVSSAPNPPRGFGNDFNGEDFVLSEAQDKLAIANGHARDAQLHFVEGDHSYFFNGHQMDYSVTQLIDQYTDKFVPELAIQMMKRSSRWPRPEYTHRSGVPWADGKIKEFWSLMGKFAKNRGKWMHYNIERYFNGLDISQESPEIKQFLKFQQSQMRSLGVAPFRTEWRVCAPDLSLAGSVDFVGSLDDGTFVIIDWKRSKKLQTGGPGGGTFHQKHMRPPLEHLTDNDASRYFLQLNIYRYILQNYYGISVSRLLLAAFHPENRGDNYVVLEAPLLEAEVAAILETL